MMMMGSFSMVMLFSVMVLWSLSAEFVVVEAAVTGMEEYVRLVDILNHRPREEEEDNNDNNNDDVATRHPRDLHMHPWDMVPVDDHDVESKTITQRLDHSTATPTDDGRSFQQRYFYSRRYVHDDMDHDKDHVQYAFLCVGGEAALLTRVLVGDIHCTGDMLELAKQLYTNNQGVSVHLFALEHRYYGGSYPRFFLNKKDFVSPLTNENLVFLSSRQALGDLAYFVEQMTSTLQQQSPQKLRALASTAPRTTIKWVTFGASYAGMLAGWARLKYPHLIHAAVSNSAPLHAQADMASYNDKVAFDLQYEHIGGSEECLQIFREGHAQLVKFVKEVQEQNNVTLQQTIADAFHLCDASILKDKDNVQTWMGDGVVKIWAQGNDPSCENSEEHEPMCNIDGLCSVALKEKSKSKEAWQVLARMAEIQHLYHDCVEFDWDGTKKFYADPIQGKIDGFRSWLWQTCTELGFFRTCEEGSMCPFALGYHPIERDFELCHYAFGLDTDEVRESIEHTNKYYGGRHLTGGSRILSVNGDVDPWATLARVNSTKEDEGLLPIYQVKGASHHFWTHQIKDTDDEEVQKARQVIYETVSQWLQT